MITTAPATTILAIINIIIIEPGEIEKISR